MSMTEAEKEKSRAADRKGAQVASFLRGDLWKDVIGEILGDLQKVSNERRRWAPREGRTQTIDEVALDTAYFSGYDDGLNELSLRLGRLVRDGQEAAQELEREEKK